MTTGAKAAPEQLALLVVTPAPVLPLRLLEMHRRYGVHEGEQCGRCAQFWHKRWGYHTYLKCAAFDSKGKAATDWQARWPACGLWASGAKDSE